MHNILSNKNRFLFFYTQDSKGKMTESIYLVQESERETDIPISWMILTPKLRKADLDLTNYVVNNPEVKTFLEMKCSVSNLNPLSAKYY